MTSKSEKCKDKTGIDLKRCMYDNVTSKSEIPDAKYYVLANDTFMSGWGEAEGKTNTLIFTASSYDEAEIVSDNAKTRSDMKRVRINSNKPSLQKSGYYYQVKTKDVAPNWYKQGYFKHQK